MGHEMTALHTSLVFQNNLWVIYQVVCISKLYVLYAVIENYIHKDVVQRPW